MSNEQKPKKQMTVGWVIVILAGISIIMAVITVRIRQKIETVEKEHMLHPDAEKFEVPEKYQPKSPLDKP